MKSADVEIPLPEEVIQHIQSFMSGKEAARTTLLSKTWYNAWLTRPTLDFDDEDFRSGGGEGWDIFEEFAKKTMTRYHEAGLKIERFRLCIWWHSSSASSDIVHTWIVGAMKMGATDVELRLPWMATLPLSCVLGSETLLSLSLTQCRVKGNYDVINCWRLKSLTLKDVRITSGDDDDVFNDIFSCCISMEELSLSQCTGFTLSLMNLHKLRRLFLHMMTVDAMFFSGFATRFPCLKDLSIVHCEGYTRVEIATNSLQTVRFQPVKNGLKNDTFDVPSIRKFTYSGSVLPTFSVNGASREWELDVSIACCRVHKPSWFMNLKKLLTKFRPSRISLSISLQYFKSGGSKNEVEIEALPKPLTVENLRIKASSKFCCALLVRLFGICRPKFVTHSLACESEKDSIDILCKRLMQKRITPNSGIPDQDMFGKFGLKQVNMEVYKEIDTQWQPLMLEKPLDAFISLKCKWKVEFELIWD